MPDAIGPPAPSSPVVRLVELIEADPRTDLAIAEAAGLRRQHLHQIKVGLRRSPSIDTVAAILAALGQPFASLDRPAASDARD